MTTPLKIAGRTFTWGTRTYLMGILNITPDSFSGDGLIADAGSGEWQESEMVQASLEQARRFVEAGVDILDVGGESTRPGSQSLDAEEEIHRVIPIIRALAAELDVLISVDTYKAR
jgi:dihydropteroate synthase